MFPPQSHESSNAAATASTSATNTDAPFPIRRSSFISSILNSTNVTTQPVPTKRKSLPNLRHDEPFGSLRKRTRSVAKIVTTLTAIEIDEVESETLPLCRAPSRKEKELVQTTLERSRSSTATCDVRMMSPVGDTSEGDQAHSQGSINLERIEPPNPINSVPRGHPNGESSTRHTSNSESTNKPVIHTKSKMAALGNRALVLNPTMFHARFQRTENYHQLNVGALFQMFQKIMFLSCMDIHSDALVAAKMVIEAKTRNFDDASRHIHHDGPKPTCYSFPSYIAALINTLGPITIGRPGTNQWQVPFFPKGVIELLKPNAYENAHYRTAFEKRMNLMLKFGLVQPEGLPSAGWWTLWPEFETRSNFLDFSTSGAPNLPVVSVFSPIDPDRIPNYLKFAMAFAPCPLVDPGITYFTATPWYPAGELKPFREALPHFRCFPHKVWAYPNCRKNLSSACFIRVQRLNAREGLIDGVEVHSLDLMTKMGTPWEDNGDSYRMVFHYFDHKFMDQCPPEMYQKLAAGLNRCEDAIPSIQVV
ncbi:hypothetical protein BGZ63DRAFT_409031 [Mariannaea sp. PMI_226]|nr:hypothetical protein BGZ63DRAFT_409031 [Mariannaea sp. PMI_226]